MSITLGDVMVKIVANSDGLQAGLDSAKGKVTSFASGMSGLVGGAVLGGVTALAGAVVGVGAAAFNAASDFDAAQKKIQSQLGLTEDQAAKAGKAVQDIFKNNFGESIEDVAQSVTEVEQAFAKLGGAGSSLQSATEAALSLRDAFGAEVNETTAAAVELMDKFGLSSTQAFDFVAAGYQKGLNASGDFTDTITEYSTQFANGGASAEQFFSILQTGMAGGVLGTDKAADAFKEFRLRIQDGSKLTADGLALLGINAGEVTKGLANGSVSAADAFDLVLDKLRSIEDPTVRMQAGAALLGTQFEDLGDSVVRAMDLSATSLDDMAGSVGKLQTQYNTLPAFFEGLGRRATVALAPLGGALLGAFNEALPSIEAWFTSVETMITNFIANSAFEWTPEFKQVKLGDFFEFIQDGAVTSINLGDYVSFTYDATTSNVSLTLADVFTFDSGDGGTQFNIADYVTFIYDNRNQKVAIYIKDVFTFVSDEGGTFVNIADYLTLNFTPKGDKLNLADQFEVDFTKAGNIQRLKIADVLEFSTGAEGTKVNIADYFSLDFASAGAKRLKVGDFIDAEGLAASALFGDALADAATSLGESLQAPAWVMDLINWKPADGPPQWVTSLLAWAFPSLPPTIALLLAWAWPAAPKEIGSILNWAWPDAPPSIATLVTWAWPEFSAGVTSAISKITNFKFPELKAPLWLDRLTSFSIPSPAWVTALLNWSPSLPGWLGGGGVNPGATSEGSIGGSGKSGLAGLQPAAVTVTINNYGPIGKQEDMEAFAYSVASRLGGR